MSDVGFIYAIQSGDLVKIGHSKNPEGRLTKINSDTSAPCRLLGYIPGTRAEESDLHRRFAPLRAHSEWFRRSGEVEAFLATLPKPKPKVKLPRKPDKRTFGRPPKPAPAPRFSAVRKKLSDDLKTVLTAFVAAADVGLDQRNIAVDMAERPDHRRRMGDSANMRASYVNSILFMSIHWPVGTSWPEGIERPEPIENRKLRWDIDFHHEQAQRNRDNDARKFQKSAIAALCALHSGIAA